MNDNACFRWAVLSALFPVVNRNYVVSNYVGFINHLNWTGIRFPVTLPQIRLFERNNPSIRINVYVYEEKGKEVIPVYTSKFTDREKQVNLLLLKDGDRSHYVWIKNMSALVRHRTNNHSYVYVCPHCIHPFTSELVFQQTLIRLFST
jgi:hypothetical protein